MVGFPEIISGIAGSVGCGGDFHGFPGTFDVVGGDLGCGFCRVVCVRVFLYEFKGVIEVLNRVSGVVRSFIAFPVDQEFVPAVVAAVIRYLLYFLFFSIVNKDRGRFVHSAGL